MNDAFDGLVLAPWDDETVDALHDYQTLGLMHPYTCPRVHHDPDTGENAEGDRVLDATEAGFICPFEGCGYTQTWAHRISADPEHMGRLKRQKAQLARWQA